MIFQLYMLRLGLTGLLGRCFVINSLCWTGRRSRDREDEVEKHFLAKEKDDVGKNRWQISWLWLSRGLVVWKAFLLPIDVG